MLVVVKSDVLGISGIFGVSGIFGIPPMLAPPEPEPPPHAVNAKHDVKIANFFIPFPFFIPDTGMLGLIKNKSNAKNTPTLSVGEQDVERKHINYFFFFTAPLAGFFLDAVLRDAATAFSVSISYSKSITSPFDRPIILLSFLRKSG